MTRSSSKPLVCAIKANQSQITGIGRLELLPYGSVLALRLGSLLLEGLEPTFN